MSWIIKIYNRDFTKTEAVWNGVTWVETNLGPTDVVINDFQFSDSTWREVEFTTIEQEDLVNRVSTSTDIILTANSKRYQFIEPLVEEVYITLPDPPKFNQRYILKNNSEINNLLLIREVVGGPVIFTLDSQDELAILFHDGIEWQISL